MVRIATGLFLSVLLSFIAKASYADDGGRAAFTTASKYFEAEEYEAALPYFKDAYTKSGRRPATIFGLAQCLRALKRYDEAIKLFNAYLATDPDNAAEVRETLGLLEEIATRRRRQEAAAEKQRAAEEAEQARLAREAQIEQEAERERERELAARAAEDRARAAAEAAIAAQPPPPAVTAPTPADEDDGGIVSSPMFWIVTGAAVVGGAVAVAMLTTGGDDVYGGNTGVVLAPLGGGR